MKKHEHETKALQGTASRQLVAFDRMKVRHEIAQRPFQESWAREILGRFDPELFKPPVLNHMGQWFWIVDGQHRVWAAKEWLGDWKNQKILCEVYDGLSIKEEAEYFLMLNNIRRVSTFDLFQIAVTAQHEDETNILALVQKHGLRIRRKTNESGSITCVGTLCRIYGYGPECLDSALLIAHESYDSLGLDSDVLGSLGVAKSRYNGTIDDKQTIAILKEMRGGLSTWRTRAARLHQETARGRVDCMAAALVDILNAKRGRGKKLPNWWVKPTAEER